MKVCKICGVEHPADKLVTDTKALDGRRALCKACKCKDQTLRNERKRAAAAQARADAKVLQAELAAEEAAKAQPYIAKARTFVRVGTWDGQGEVAYYRNEGNKHIPSRGVLC